MPKFILIYFFVHLLRFDAQSSPFWGWGKVSSESKENDNMLFETREITASLPSNEEKDKTDQVCTDLSEDSLNTDLKPDRSNSWPTSSSSTPALTSPKVQICRKVKPYPFTMGGQISVGASNYQQLVESSRYWSDKSGLIETILTTSYKVYLITCPRRSGKSINLSMISTFVEIPSYSEIKKIPLSSSFAYKYFANGIVTSFQHPDVEVIPPPIISKNTELIEKYLGKYPVIHITFSGVSIYNDLHYLKGMIIELYRQHGYLLNTLFSENATKHNYGLKQKFDEYQKRKTQDMSENELMTSISFLSELLHMHHKKKVMIFIDEYDNIINQLILPQYDGENLDTLRLLNFYRDFLVESCRLNEFREKVVLTGILKFEDLSGMSNWEDGAMLTNLMEPSDFYQYYRFTPKEVEELLLLAKNSNFTPKWKEFNREDFSMKDIAENYDGYTTYKDEPSSYNTLSIVWFINMAKMDSYWVSSSSIRPILELFRFKNFEDTITNLLDNGTYPMIKNDIQDIQWEDMKALRVFFYDTGTDMEFSDNNLKTTIILLSFLGYLTPVRNSLRADKFFDMRILNNEVREDWLNYWRHLILNPNIKKTIQNKMHCNYKEEYGILQRVKDFFASIMTNAASISKDFMKKNLQDLLIKANSEEIERCANKIIEVWGSSIKRLRKVLLLWNALEEFLCFL